ALRRQRPLGDEGDPAQVRCRGTAAPRAGPARGHLQPSPHAWRHRVVDARLWLRVGFLRCAKRTDHALSAGAVLRTRISEVLRHLGGARLAFAGPRDWTRLDARA